MNKIELGKNIKISRNNLGYSLRDVSARTGISASFLSDIENERTNPSVKTLKILASCLRTSVSALLGEEKRNKKFYMSSNFCVNIDDISSIEPAKNPADPEFPFNVNFINKNSGWTINNAFKKRLFKFIEENDGDI